MPMLDQFCMPIDIIIIEVFEKRKYNPLETGGYFWFIM
jgi:hypothetical protein